MESFFAKLEDLVSDLNTSNSKLDKIETLGEYKKDTEVKKIMKFVYSENITFGVKSSRVIKYKKSKKSVRVKEYTDIFKLLKDLEKRKLSGHAALQAVNDFIDEHDEYEDLIYKIIDKNLKIMMGIPNINKALGKGTIPTFEPALAKKYTEKILEKSKNNKWFISRKLDGVRCLLYVNKEDDDVIMYSRTGKPLGKFMSVLSELGKKLKDIPYDKFYLDGELVYYEDDMTENFQEMIKQIKRGDNPPDNHNKNVKYLVFDILTETEFITKKSEITYEERYKILDKLFKTKSKKEQKGRNILRLTQVEYNEKNFEKWQKMAGKYEWEGLMVRKADVGYKGGRSNDLLKVKKFQDEEFKVIRITESKMPILNKKTGKNTITPIMGAIVIDYYDTQVGSGFSVEERKMYLKNPELIIGKMVTVQYFEKTIGEKGIPSLRFPTFKGIRDYE